MEQVLREKNVRKMGCIYCTYGGKLLVWGRNKLSKKGDFYPGVDIGVDPEKNVLFVEAVADVYEPSFVEAAIEISFCPMCGRYLKEEI